MMSRAYVVELYPRRPRAGERPAKTIELQATSALDAVHSAKAVLIKGEGPYTYIKASLKEPEPAGS